MTAAHQTWHNTNNFMNKILPLILTCLQLQAAVTIRNLSDLDALPTPGTNVIIYIVQLGATNAPYKLTPSLTNLSSISGKSILSVDAIDTEAEFESLLFTLPSGGGGSVFVNGSEVAGINLTNSTYIVFNVNGTNVTAYATNLTAAHLATDSVSADELDEAGVESGLEAVLDLQDQQGAVTDAQVPNTITVDLATVATTANAGDSATAFFSSGEIEDVRLPSTLTRDTEWDTIAEIETATSVNIIVSTEIDSVAKIETLTGANILTSTEGDAAYVPLARTLTAGAGLSGGGDLSANRTFTLDPTTWSSGTFTLGNSSQASIVFGFGLSGATDPTITAANNSLSANVPFGVPDGLVGEPGITFVSDPDNGFYRSGANLWNMAVGGQRKLIITTSLFGMDPAHQIGWYSSGFAAFDTSFARDSAGVAKVISGGGSTLGGFKASTLTLTPAAANTTALTISGGSNTGSDVTPGDSFAWTWNTSGHAIAKRNIITDTASGANAAIETWETAGGGVQAAITKVGNVISNLRASKAVAGTIASATTIAPTAAITFISGTTAIDTITAPYPISSTGGQITLIPTAIWTTTTSGNIALASTAVVNKALTLFYDATTTKWYPSY
jgi:hypothetical protein